MYIGRAMLKPKLRRSVLHNPFDAEVERCLEKYRRRLARQVIQRGFPEVKALQLLKPDSTLACWCVERQATRVYAGHALPAQLCHGDIVFTMWTACSSIGWDRLPSVDFMEDPDGANSAWREMYQSAYGQPMIWGEKAGQFGFDQHFTREQLR